MAYDGERVDAPVVDQLETILRHVADELGLWRARATKAEADLKEGGSRGAGGGATGAGGAGGASGTAKLDPETRVRVADLEQENKTLRSRVEAARGRVHDLLSRLAFLEEQARDAGGKASGAGTAAGAPST